MHIPFYVPPYEDELLYSWVLRLAKANELSVSLFFETYFGKECFSKFSRVPVDIRKGFNSFYNYLPCEISAPELYLSLSTIQFELLSYPQKMQTKFINPIFRKESKINTIREYLMTDFRMCKECMGEDRELFGETYIHRSHQLSGVCVCHKHHTPLFVQKRNAKYDYKDETLEQIELTDDFKKECEYADYTHFLLKSNFQSNSNDLMEIILDKLGIQESNKKEIVNKINQILQNGKTDTEYSPWFRKNNYFPIKDFVKVLMYLYPNPEDVLIKTKKSALILAQKCDKCGKFFYITEQGLKDGWGCTFCDDELQETELIKRLVEVGGNGEYVFKGFVQSKSNNVLLLHKPCGKEIATNLNNFLFLHTRCDCNQRLSRKDAEKRLKKHPQFKLIKFNGSSRPAKFLHTICGHEFETNSFRDILETPKCRCCEIQPDITQEIFEQEVRDVVGDEYTVLGQVSTRDGRVPIRHNSCGHVHDYKVHEFLSGSRCPQCYSKVSDKKLKAMLAEYADDRYELIGKDAHRIFLYDHIENKEIKLKGNHIVQELLRPTPSSILPTDKCLNIEKALNTFDHWYILCAQYKKEYGHLCVGHEEKYQGHALGCWCSETRIANNKGELPQEQIDALNGIGFVWNAVFYTWNKRFEEYKDYVKETGNYFPRTDCIHNGHKVGSWFLGQRKERKKGKLNPEYEKILLEYNPDFFKERNAWNTTRKKVSNSQN